MHITNRKGGFSNSLNSLVWDESLRHLFGPTEQMSWGGVVILTPKMLLLLSILVFFFPKIFFFIKHNFITHLYNEIVLSLYIVGCEKKK